MAELSPEARQDMQGIILSGYGHLNFASFLFIQFQDPAKGIAWLKNIISKITTAGPWQVLADGTKVKPKTALNLALTFPGFKALGSPKETLDSFSTEFIQGVSTRATILGDVGESSPDKWEIGGPNNKEVHALLMLYGENDQELDKLCQDQRKLIQESNGGVIEIGEEPGSRPKNLKEHFGFRDGISQPKLEGTRGSPVPGDPVITTGEFILGYRNEFGLYPESPSVSVTNDPGEILPMFPENAVPDCRDFGRNGTYLVYRKLAQDVAGFWRFIEHASDGLGGAEDIEEKHKQMRWLAAKFTGRWPGGAPLTLSPDQDDAKLEKENNFTYRPEDMNGNACPIGSHIRRSNPRDSILRVKDTAEQSFRTSGEHRIIRRGIGYGEPLFPAEAIENPHVPMGIQDDGRPRGLQFFAINASIKRQFEFIQQTWLNNSKFNGLEDNKDPISGDNDGLSHMEIQSDPLRIRITGVPRFVTVKGGAYFFLPSITALNFLANRPVVPEAG